MSCRQVRPAVSACNSRSPGPKRMPARPLAAKVARTASGPPHRAQDGVVGQIVALGHGEAEQLAQSRGVAVASHLRRQRLVEHDQVARRDPYRIVQRAQPAVGPDRAGSTRPTAWTRSAAAAAGRRPRSPPSRHPRGARTRPPCRRSRAPAGGSPTRCRATAGSPDHRAGWVRAGAPRPRPGALERRALRRRPRRRDAAGERDGHEQGDGARAGDGRRKTLNHPNPPVRPPVTGR